MSCRLIIAAFSPDRSDLRSFVLGLLEGRGLTVSRVEDVHQPQRTGLLIFAESSACDSLNLLRLRDDLVRAGEPRRIRFRVQREDLFRAMHRLESPFAS